MLEGLFIFYIAIVCRNAIVVGGERARKLSEPCPEQNANQPHRLRKLKSHFRRIINGHVFCFFMLFIVSYLFFSFS